MINEIRRTIRKDFFNSASYKIDVFFSITAAFTSFFIAFFMAKIISKEQFGNYGYLFFSIVGGINYSISGRIISTASSIVISGRTSGLLLPALFAFKSIPKLIILNSFYPFFRGIIGMYLQFILLKLFIPELPLPFLPLLGLALAIPSFIGFSMISVSLTLLFKKNIFSYLLSVASFLLAGISFPVEVLHSSLIYLAKLLPLTHLNTFSRASFSNQIDLESLKYLIFLSILYPIIGVLLLSVSEKFVKKRGELFNW